MILSTCLPSSPGRMLGIADRPSLAAFGFSRIDLKSPSPRLSSSPSSSCLCVSSQTHDDGGVRCGDSSFELRVCTHRTCRKSGSLNTLELLRDLASPNITVQSCGCLGRCGSGPNLVVLPSEVFVSHCNTGAHAARLLALQCGVDNPRKNLEALALKHKGNKAFESGDLTEAEALFSQAIDLEPSGGLHYLYSNRSAVRLLRNDTQGALEDALHAAHLAPRWHTPLLRQGEVHMAAGDHEAAALAFKKALALDPSLRRSKSYQKKIRELEVAMGGQENL